MAAPSHRPVRTLLDRPLPEPPRALRRGPLREGAFRAALHDERTAALVGRWLGIAFTVCFLTGMISHVHQHPPAFLDLPSRPVWGYRLSQGLHVGTGLALIPLLLAKLHVVYPRLFAWPPARSLRHAAERGSVLVLIGAALFQVTTGVANIAQWYPFGFGFLTAHYLTAYVAIGALALHVAVQWPAIRRGLRRRSVRINAEDAEEPGRRAFLVGVGVAVAAVTAVTAGQTVRPLERVAVLAPRRPSVGEQGLPVNRTAAQAGVTQTAVDPSWALSLSGPSGERRLTLEELRGLELVEATLPIACVEGWSSSARWRGVRVRDLAALVGGAVGDRVRVTSLEERGAYRVSTLGAAHAADPLTLLAVELFGRPLSVDHGFPARIIAPNRPGVLQTKWVGRLEVLR